MSESLVKVRLPWLELRPADTYEELCESLIQLDEAVEEIFGRVERRIDEEQAKLKGFEARIERAGILTGRIAGSKNATCVLSAARYPAEDKLPDYRRLFYDEAAFATKEQARVPPLNLTSRVLLRTPPPLLPPRAQEKLKLPPPPVVEPPQAIVERREALQAALQQDADAMPDYLHALSLCSDLAANAPANAPTASAYEQGLGPLPEAISERGSASNLLLFNTEHNVYVQYRPLDNLSGEEEREEEPEKDRATLHEAPDTVRFGDQLPEVERTDFSYKPLLGEVPQLEVPSMLPDLKNVADLNWTAADLPSIAPSLANAVCHGLDR